MPNRLTARDVMESTESRFVISIEIAIEGESVLPVLSLNIDDILSSETRSVRIMLAPAADMAADTSLPMRPAAPVTRTDLSLRLKISGPRLVLSGLIISF